MQIYGASHVHGAHGPNSPHSPRQAQGPAASRPQTVDQLDISPEANAASQAGATSESNEVRTDLVARIKSEIASGTYETADKMDGALSRLLDEIG